MKRPPELYQIDFFDFDKAEVIVKYRTCVFEIKSTDPGKEKFLIPVTPGIINLDKVKLLKSGFFTRMTFRECYPEEITSSNHFHRWLRVRNIYFMDAMIFIKQSGKTFCLYKDRGPVYLPLQNGCYYHLIKNLQSKKG